MEEVESSEEFTKKVRELYRSKLLEKYTPLIVSIKGDIIRAIEKGQNSFDFFVDENDDIVVDFIKAYFKDIGVFEYNSYFRDRMTMTLNLGIPNLNDDWV